MELKLHNTLTRAKEVFVPLEAGKAGIYTCGPTVYAEAHIGNLRSYVFPDILKKTLRRLGYTVTHIINVTDVGHLTSDEDTGEDKIEQAARESRRTAWDIAEEYTRLYLADLERLNIEMPDHLPKATGHIPEQIAIIEKLEAGGYAYRIEDGIYFDTAKFPAYGKLARLDVEGLREGSRVEMGDKRHKTDFALWKFCPEGVQRQMEWDSPWGRGFPGWHVECSAMSMKYLGQTFDIHTGGTDHIPVHHTNEIAQSEAANGQPFVRYWLHGQYLVLGEDERMGKSEGNMVTLGKLIEEGFDPLAFRYLALNTHYRQYLNFTRQALKAADTALMGLRRILYEAGGVPPDLPANTDGDPSTPGERRLLEFLCDDLNTPKVLGQLWSLLRDSSISAEGKSRIAAYADGILSLGLFDFSRLEAMHEVPDAVRELAETRWAARQAKDFPESDRLREEIEVAGYVVRDREDGYDLEKAQG
ncbi:MAG: cysteine--tRNA ligase [bacterium]